MKWQPIKRQEVFVFDLRTYFLAEYSLRHGEKTKLVFFKYQCFAPFSGPFRSFSFFSSLFFVILLHGLQVIPIDVQTWFLAHRVSMKALWGVFNDFMNFAFLPLLGAHLKKGHKTKRLNFGIYFLVCRLNVTIGNRKKI